MSDQQGLPERAAPTLTLAQCIAQGQHQLFLSASVYHEHSDDDRPDMFGRTAASLAADTVPKHEPKPVQFYMADGSGPYDGEWDGSRWNGWANVTISVAERDRMVAKLTSEYESWLETSGVTAGTLDEWLSDIDTLPVTDGRVSLANGYCMTLAEDMTPCEHGGDLGCSRCYP